ncbi:MAG: hypothetical protein AB7J35_15675 [Dehalococcoidia bacterium]
MNRKYLVFATAPLALLALASCGDGPNKTIDSVTPGATTTRSNLEADFGPAPVLGDNILKVSPGYAEQVKQAATRTPNPNKPSGVCAEVSFEGLPQTGQWFRMALDGTEVTTELTWIVSSTESPTGGTMCFAPAEGITVGKHDAAISVQDPNNIQARTKQLVAWRFEVIE